MASNSIFSGTDAKVVVEFLELDSFMPPGDGFVEVSITLPRFAIDEIRDWLPPVFFGTASWPTTNYKSLKFYVPNPTGGKTIENGVSAVAAFGQSVLHTQQAWALYLKLRDNGAAHEDCWTLVPERWMWQLWRFQCPGRLIPEAFRYDLGEIIDVSDSMTQEGAVYAKWLVGAIEESAEAGREGGGNE